MTTRGGVKKKKKSYAKPRPYMYDPYRQTIVRRVPGDIRIRRTNNNDDDGDGESSELSPLTARKHKPYKIDDDDEAAQEQGCGRDDDNDGGGRKATTRRINTETTSAPNRANRNVGVQYNYGGAINDNVKPLTSTTAAAASAKSTSIRSRSKHVGIHKEESPDNMKGGGITTTTIVPRRMSREVDALLASSMTSGPPLSRKLFLDDTTTTTGARKGGEQHTVVASAAGHRGRHSTRGDGRVVLGDRSNNTTTKNNDVSARTMGDSKRKLNSFIAYFTLNYTIVRHFINMVTSFSISSICPRWTSIEPTTESN
jgi:hypothetical protein